MIRSTKISVCALLILNGLSVNAMDTNTNDHVFKNVKSVHIISDEGHINIKGGNGPDVHLKHRFNDRGTNIATNLQNGALHITNKKNNNGGNCDLTLNVPKTVPVTTELGAGNITFENLKSNVNLNLGAGHIKISVNEIPSTACTLVLKTGSGSVDLFLPRNGLVKYTRRPAVWGGQVNLFASETSGSDYNFLVTANTGIGNITVDNNKEATF